MSRAVIVGDSAGLAKGDSLVRSALASRPQLLLLAVGLGGDDDDGGDGEDPVNPRSWAIGCACNTERLPIFIVDTTLSRVRRNLKNLPTIFYPPPRRQISRTVLCERTGSPYLQHRHDN